MMQTHSKGVRYSLVDKARAFAIAAHGAIGQVRKYTGEPYVNHPIRVAATVSNVTQDQAMIAAALLHDVVEDTQVTLKDIRDEFGDDVATLVGHLTDVSTPADGNRAARKEIDYRHTEKASARAQTIKIADLLDNTSSILQFDLEFAKVYLAEKERLLMGALVHGDPYLWRLAHKQLEYGLHRLRMQSFEVES